MKKLVGFVLLLVSMTSLEAKVNVISEENIGSDESHFVKKLCIDGYVYITIYQKKPVMTIQYGRQTALTEYPVLQGIVQSYVNGSITPKPETCK